MNAMNTQRYALQRYDGAYFHHPSMFDAREWVSDLQVAHLWVDIHACAAAAYLHSQLHHEEVQVTPVLLTPTGNRVEARYATSA